MANRHKPNADSIAWRLHSTYCTSHGTTVQRSACLACLQDRMRSTVAESVHPDCAIPEVARALQTPGLVGPENVRELARIFDTTRALFALDLFAVLIQLTRRRS